MFCYGWIWPLRYHTHKSGKDGIFYNVYARHIVIREIAANKTLALGQEKIPKDPAMIIVCPTKTLEDDMIWINSHRTVKIWLNSAVGRHNRSLLPNQQWLCDPACLRRMVSPTKGPKWWTTYDDTTVWVQSRTTKAHHFHWGRKARRNGPIFVGSSSALKKELIAHFSVFLANCLWHRQILKVKKCKYRVLA